LKILITGGAGFIGSHVADGFLESGHEVVVLDDLSTGSRENLSPRARFYETDIRSSEVARIFERERPAIVNHHAAQMDVRRAVREPDFDASVNILGSLNVLECARRFGARKLVFASTGGAVYGESRRLPVDESHQIAPLSPYGVSKFAFEQYLAAYHRLHGLSYTVLRYPNVYGPRQNPNGEAGVVAIFAGQLLRGETPTIFGDGEKTRDYVHVSDVVEANRLALVEDRGEVFNLGWGEEVSDRAIFEAVSRAVGVSVAPLWSDARPGEVQRICLDSSRIRERLGWTPKVRLEEGVLDVVRYQRERLKARGEVSGCEAS
jgi:UDP-glucose 4-epimerase